MVGVNVNNTFNAYQLLPAID